ncbi:hypothetical protein HDU96_009320 [Phlyctochytrium bullatum]|nr:hypothetical protein HDU96_009320 [Phlyctochytrium bullatum]
MLPSALMLALVPAFLLINTPSTVWAAEYDTLTQLGSPLRHGHIPTANLDPAVVGSRTFGRVFPGGFTTLPAINGIEAGTNYATPLVYTTPEGRVIVLAATQNNNVYAVDGTTGALIASRNLDIPFQMKRDFPGCGDINSNVGITGTPVIDPTTGTAYMYTKSYAPGTTIGVTNGRYRLHAIDVVTLQERPNFPLDLENVIADNDPSRGFKGGYHLQRPALHLEDGIVYGAFGSHCDMYNYTGWVVGVTAQTAQVTAAFVTEVSSKGGSGIWQSGNGISSLNGKLYLTAGNGNTSPQRTPVAGSQPPNVLGQAVFELTIDKATGKLSCTDFFMPYNYQALNGADKDLGSGGVTILPPEFSTPKVKNVGVAMGKEGLAYILNLDNLGGFQQGSAATDDVIQIVSTLDTTYGQAAAWPGNGGYLYWVATGVPLAAYKFTVDSAGLPKFVTAGAALDKTRQYSGSPVVTSINGQDDTGIVWYIDFSGALTAYRAVPVNNVLQVLYSDTPSGVYPYNKFQRPGFGNGRVYTVTGDGRMFAYGSPTDFPLTAKEGNFGTVLVGVPKTLTVNFTVQVDTVQVLGATFSDANFTLGAGAPTFPVTLKKGDVFQVPVTVTTKSSGFFTAQLNLQTSNAVRSLAYASLRGQSRSKEPLLMINPPVLEYFGVVTNSTSITAIASIYNDGVDALVITGVELPSADGPFKVLDPPTVGTVIESGFTITLSVLFKPTRDGQWSEFFKVMSNGGNKYIAMSGSSAGPPLFKLLAQQPDGTYVDQTRFDNPSIEFGSLTPGGRLSLNVNVTNVGPTDLTIYKSKIPQSGAIVGDQSLLAEGVRIKPNGTVTIPIVFTHPNRPPAVLGASSYRVSSEFVINTDDLTVGLKEMFFYGTVSFPQIPANLSNWRYSDCYTYSGTRILNNGRTGTMSSYMTPQICMTNCAAAKFPVAGIEYAQECWCGTALPTVAPNPSACTLPCKGDSTLLCGAGSALNVYYDSSVITPVTTTTTAVATPTPTPTPTPSPSPTPTPAPSAWSYIGCTVSGGEFNGTQVPRFFEGGKLADANYTPATCQAACLAANLGYTFAGVEYGGECWCGKSIASRIPAPEADCSTACNADGSQICGNGNRMSLYGLNVVPGTSSSSAIVAPTPTPTPTPTPSPSPSPTPSPSAWTYIGCTVSGGQFNGTEVPRFFEGGKLGSGFVPETCQAACLAANLDYTFSGVEYGGECWCGKSIASRIPAPESDCSTRCDVDNTKICGNGNRMSLYGLTVAPTSSSSAVVTVPPTPTPTPLPTDPIMPGTNTTTTTTTATSSVAPIPTSWQYVGCTLDNPRLFTGGLQGSGFVPSTCFTACLAKKLYFAGLQYGGECWCGSSIANRIAAPEKECNMPCKLDTTQMCGAGLRMSLYGYTVPAADAAASLTPSSVTPAAPSPSPATPAAPSPSPVAPAVVVTSSTEAVPLTTTLSAVTTSTLAAPSWKYVACTVDGGTFNGVAVPRLLSHRVTGANYTPATCQAACVALNRGYVWSGVQFGGECWCGTDASKRVVAPESQCSMKCKADTTQICGGSLRNSLYQFA